ncbi:MAG: N-6 DNA methylase [Candidatus Aminicenantes bacterium]|nr:N-6 DNA methylase [Candidatus Aminicenantes bacterium]
MEIANVIKDIMDIIRKDIGIFCYKQQISQFAWKVPIEKIIENKYNLDIKNPNISHDKK